MLNTILVTLIFSVLGTTVISSKAAEKMDMPISAKATTIQESILGNGQVILISQDKTKVTLKHQPIPAIQWPAMTMEFKVKNRALLDKVKVGDKVHFILVPVGKEYIVTSIK